MKRVLVLGSTGMLGSMVADVLARSENIHLTVTARDPDRQGVQGPAAEAACLPFDAAQPEAISDLAARGFDWIINAIGIIKPYIRDTDSAQTERAVRVNALFPHVLARAAERHDLRVLQIATDCVYSGREGRYAEDAPHDPLDAYGKTKSLGEVHSRSLHHLRCSIIGPEIKGHVSLLDWFLGQPKGAQLTGYANHRWNGVTTYHFARICRGIIETGLELPSCQHVVPEGIVTKADMLEGFALAYGRTDLSIQRGEAPTVIDRTLDTRQGNINRALWQAAGYAAPPHFREMMAELVRHPFNQ